MRNYFEGDSFVGNRTVEFPNVISHCQIITCLQNAVLDSFLATKWNDRVNLRDPIYSLESAPEMIFREDINTTNKPGLRISS